VDTACLVLRDTSSEWIAQPLRPSNEWNREERAELEESFTAGERCHLKVDMSITKR
jgi:hypothetical protein